MKQRDTFMSADYWSDFIRFQEGAIDNFESRLVACQDSDTILHFTDVLFSYRLDLFEAYYSQGRGIPFLASFFPRVIEHLKDCLSDGRPYLRIKNYDDYVDMIRVASLCILLDYEHSRDSIDLMNHRGVDAFYDDLTSFSLDGRATSSAKFLFPSKYRALHRLFLAGEAERVKILDRHMERYYSLIKNAYWYDRHLLPESGFFGYWCFEAAAMVKLLRIPEGRYAESIYFPRDLL